MEADDLYGLPLDEFVPQRGALAKSLRAQKRRDEAAEVAALRKPSIAAWAVNQLVRTQRDALRALFEAGDGLRGAQEDLLAGRGDGRKLRAANQLEREAVETLVEAARGLLTSGGFELSAAVVERVDETLHAAALDMQARDQVRDGRLERELRHVGLGFGFGEALAATPAPRAKRADAGPAVGKGGAAKGGAATGGAATGGGKTGGAKTGGAAKGGAAKGGAAKRGATKRGEADDGGAAAAKASAEERRAERERAAAEREEAKRAERERAEARKAARAAETAARRRADAAARALEKAQRRRDDAAQALREADDALAAAREDVEEALAEHERAKTALDEI